VASRSRNTGVACTAATTAFAAVIGCPPR
jgi:hypothetical protein